MSVKYTYSFGKTGPNLFNANNVLLLPNIYVTLTKHSESLLNRLRSKSLSSKLSFKRMHREWLKHLIFCNRKCCSILENLFQQLRNDCINIVLFEYWLLFFFVLIGITAPSWLAIFHMNYCTFLHSKIYVCKKSIQIGSYNNLQMMQKYFLKLQRGRKSVENCRPWNNLCFKKRPE